MKPEASSPRTSPPAAAQAEQPSQPKKARSKGSETPRVPAEPLPQKEIQERKPKVENVEFFAAPKQALFAGYRPCLKCHPLKADEEPAWVRRLIDRVEKTPEGRIRERDLRAMHIEPARVRRYFAARYGLTFQAYCRARRLAHPPGIGEGARAG